MENIIWYVIMIPCSLILTAIGVFAWNRKKPMWFWIGNEIKESEISDVRAYNHANGLMWGLYSLVFWAATAPRPRAFGAISRRLLSSRRVASSGFR